MVIISFIGIACISVLLYMYKEAHENNIRSHEVKAIGDNETIHLYFISDTHARKINEAMIDSIDQNIQAVLIGEILSIVGLLKIQCSIIYAC